MNSQDEIHQKENGDRKSVLIQFCGQTFLFLRVPTENPPASGTEVHYSSEYLGTTVSSCVKVTSGLHCKWAVSQNLSPSSSEKSKEHIIQDKMKHNPLFPGQSPLSPQALTHGIHFMVYLLITGFCQGSFLLYPGGMQADACSSPPSGIWLHSMQSLNAVWMNGPSSGSLPYSVFIPHSTWLESKRSLLLGMLCSC